MSALVHGMTQNYLPDGLIIELEKAEYFQPIDFNE